MPITLRRATAEDAIALSALAIRTYEETWGDSYPRDELADFLQAHYGLAAQQAELADPAGATWLLEDEGVAVGYLSAGANELPHPTAGDGDIELKRFYLLASHQGGGHGTAMMQCLLKWVDVPKPRTLWVGVWEENHGAQRFYQRYGFVKAGEYDFIVGSTVDREFILRRPAITA